MRPEALQPLFNAFWTHQGWRSPPAVPDAVDFERAVRNGVMFAQPLMLDHDGWVDRVLAAAARLSVSAVSAAFLASLDTRRLDLRSALGSYAVARHLPRHTFEADRTGVRCRVCGLHERPSVEDLNVLSFERFKWGGVRHDQLEYVAFDLEQFQHAPQEPLTEAALRLGRSLLAALRSSGTSTTSTTVVRDLSMIRGNAQERRVLVDILGLTGVIGSAEHPGFDDHFIAYADRDVPERHFVDSAYPACWWRGGDGLNEDAVQEFLAPLG